MPSAAGAVARPGGGGMARPGGGGMARPGGGGMARPGGRWHDTAANAGMSARRHDPAVHAHEPAQR